MIAVAGRGAFRAEGEHDLWPLAADKGDDLADHDVGVRRRERTVRMAAMVDRGNTEQRGGLDQLRAPDASQLLARRNRDAGRTSGIPVSG